MSQYVQKKVFPAVVQATPEVEPFLLSSSSLPFPSRMKAGFKTRTPGVADNGPRHTLFHEAAAPGDVTVEPRPRLLPRHIVLILFLLL